MMKNKIIGVIMLLSLMSFSHALYPATCLVDTNTSKNKGWCVEGVDGKGKCIVDKQEDADKCVLSETIEVIME